MNIKIVSAKNYELVFVNDLFADLVIKDGSLYREVGIKKISPEIFKDLIFICFVGDMSKEALLTTIRLNLK